jgi:hypothetical protein
MAWRWPSPTKCLFAGVSWPDGSPSRDGGGRLTQQVTEEACRFTWPGRAMSRRLFLCASARDGCFRDSGFRDPSSSATQQIALPTTVAGLVLDEDQVFRPESPALGLVQQILLHGRV